MINRNLVLAGAIATATILGAIGGSTLNALSTFAATDTTTPTVVTAQNATTTQTDTTPSTQPQFDPSKGSHMGQNGMKEELLTGDTAEKVKQAALAAVPGGTILRVETDAEGSPYEAHMTKSDGSQVTVKVDSNFNVTTTETGGPGGPRGGQNQSN
jgi:hypothetical protein